MTPCPRCTKPARWVRPPGGESTALRCDACGWSSVAEPSRYSSGVAIATCVIYLAAGAAWWSVLGAAQLVVGVDSPLMTVGRGLIDWRRFLAFQAVLGAVVGHILNTTLGRGQRDQNVRLIVTVPIVLFVVAGLLQGLTLATPLCLPAVEEIALRPWWVRAAVGVLLGRVSVRPMIRLVRSIRIALGLRGQA